jgi:hypothetical protein
MLRLVLDWFSSHKIPGHPLSFQPESTWFSEALLPSPFAPRYHGDKRAEAHTHADGLIGHFRLGSVGKSDAVVLPDADQLLVTEAKMYSPLSEGTRYAPSYDQAARNVACIAEMLSRARRIPSRLSSLGFLVLAPEDQTRDPAISDRLNKGSIESKVRERAAPYRPELDSWLEDWLVPTVEESTISALSWEGLIADIKSQDEKAGQSLSAFYQKCLIYNSRDDHEVPA